MGLDLNRDIVGHLPFVEVICLLLMGRRPSPAEVQMADALLVVLMDHGFTASSVATRLIFHMAPESVQGAVAAGLLGAGSRHLGTSEHCARMLQEALRAEPEAATEDLARRIVDGYAARDARIPGIGHHTHSAGDPRAARLFEVARETGTFGPHCRLLEAVQQRAEVRSQRRLPLNVTGATGAIISDLGLPWQLGKALSLIGRTAGLLAHVREEVEHPVGLAISEAVLEHVQYTPPDAG